MSISGRLAGRTALITGASRGIGAAVARRFVAEGASVALGHEPTTAMAASASDLAAELNAAGGRCVAIAADLADVEQPVELVRRVRAELGPLSVLVANAAGLSPRRPFHEIPVAEWDRMQAINVRATWLMAGAAREDLIATRGSLITVTSVMIETGQTGALHYTASKAAIVGMTRALARELGPDEVRVNAIMPGAIRTEHEESLAPDAQAVAARILSAQSLPRRGLAEDLTGAFTFLASADSEFVTGQVLNVDGGWVMY